MVKTGEIRHEIVVGVTSCDANRATPADLLAAVRQHWTIENQVHGTRDVTGKEDASHVRTGSAPPHARQFPQRGAEWVRPEEEKRHRLPTPESGVGPECDHGRRDRRCLICWVRIDCLGVTQSQATGWVGMSTCRKRHRWECQPLLVDLAPLLLTILS